jgi:hypothetical protein
MVDIAAFGGIAEQQSGQMITRQAGGAQTRQWNTGFLNWNKEFFRFSAVNATTDVARTTTSGLKTCKRHADYLGKREVFGLLAKDPRFHFPWHGGRADMVERPCLRLYSAPACRRGLLGLAGPSGISADMAWFRNWMWCSNYNLEVLWQDLRTPVY